MRIARPKSWCSKHADCSWSIPETNQTTCVRPQFDVSTIRLRLAIAKRIIGTRAHHHTQLDCCRITGLAEISTLSLHIVRYLDVNSPMDKKMIRTFNATKCKIFESIRKCIQNNPNKMNEYR